MAGVQATVTNLSLDNAPDGTSIKGSDAARLMVCPVEGRQFQQLSPFTRYAGAVLYLYGLWHIAVRGREHFLQIHRGMSILLRRLEISDMRLHLTPLVYLQPLSIVQLMLHRRHHSRAIRALCHRTTCRRHCCSVSLANPACK